MQALLWCCQYFSVSWVIKGLQDSKNFYYLLPDLHLLSSQLRLKANAFFTRIGTASLPLCHTSVSVPDGTSRVPCFEPAAAPLGTSGCLGFSKKWKLLPCPMFWLYAKISYRSTCFETGTWIRIFSISKHYCRSFAFQTLSIFVPILTE